MSSSRKIYIAVVDDDESACRSLSRLLRAADFNAVTYPSAEAFLWDRKHPHFDCLVLDIQLGGMSGIELQRRLVTAGDATPVLFITGHDAPEVREQAQAAGCVGYFRKRDTGDEILGVIRRVVTPALPAKSNGFPAAHPQTKQ